VLRWEHPSGEKHFAFSSPNANMPLRKAGPERAQSGKLRQPLLPAKTKRKNFEVAK